jgi:RimJ/RimL family protein N-acetyltransferase
MRYFNKLAGTQCYLSPINVEDAETYAAWLNDPEIARSLLMTADNISLVTQRQRLEELAAGHLYSVVNPATDTVIGSAGLKDIDNLHRTCLISVFIGEKELWGQGYGAEAMRLLLGYAFDHLNLHSVRLTVFAFNSRAIALYRRLGFKEAGRWRDGLRREGRFHDVILMDILENEFRAASVPAGT